MSQRSLSPKIRFLRQKVCPVPHSHTDRHTERHTDRVTTEGTLSGFQDFFPSTYHQGSAQYLNKITILAASSKLSTEMIFIPLAAIKALASSTRVPA